MDDELGIQFIMVEVPADNAEAEAFASKALASMAAQKAAMKKDVENQKAFAQQFQSYQKKIASLWEEKEKTLTTLSKAEIQAKADKHLADLAKQQEQIQKQMAEWQKLTPEEQLKKTQEMTAQWQKISPEEQQKKMEEMQLQQMESQWLLKQAGKSVPGFGMGFGIGVGGGGFYGSGYPAPGASASPVPSSSF